MSKPKILTALFCFSFFTAWSQHVKSVTDFFVNNRSIDLVADQDKAVIRFSEAEGQGIAWVRDAAFLEGTIEFDARGRDVLQKSFIGIAFHGKDYETFETIYFRPFNFQSTDPVRKIHAVQYTYEPQFGFQALRNSRKDEFESAIKPAGIQASDWFHVKVVVRGKKVIVFMNGSDAPCLEVETLNPKPEGIKIGYWVGNNSNGDFANLKISK